MTLVLTPLPPCSFKRTHAHTFSHTRTNTSCRDNNARHCVTASSIVSPHGQRTPGNAQRTTLGTRELDHPSHKIPVRICGHSFRPIRSGEQSALAGGGIPQQTVVLTICTETIKVPGILQTNRHMHSTFPPHTC